MINQAFLLSGFLSFSLSLPFSPSLMRLPRIHRPRRRHERRVNPYKVPGKQYKHCLGSVGGLRHNPIQVATKKDIAKANAKKAASIKMGQGVKGDGENEEEQQSPNYHYSAPARYEKHAATSEHSQEGCPTCWATCWLAFCECLLFLRGFHHGRSLNF